MLPSQPALFRRFRTLSLACLAALGLAGCGGDDSSSAPHHTVGGTVSGLTGTLVLRNRGVDSLTLAANGGFVFGNTVPRGGVYQVSVASQPADQTCTVNNGTGAVGDANVTSVQVACTVNAGATTHTVGGNVSNLNGTLVLRNNNADPLTITADDNFTFSNPVNNGGHYLVTVATQPAGQTCSVNNASGTISGGNVSNVQVTCASNTYTVGGRVNGLVGGGAEPLKLQLNGGSELTLNGDGTFTFPGSLAHGSAYGVTVTGKPVAQTCSIANHSSSAITGHVSNIYVYCATSTLSIGGTISGLDGSIGLSNNINHQLIRDSNGTFAFSTKLPYNSSYAVTVHAQPAGQQCTLANASGVATTNVTDIQVTCTNKPYLVTVQVGGMAEGAGPITLQNNGGDDLVINGNGQHVFATPVLHGSDWKVTTLSIPADHICSQVQHSGTIAGTNAVTYLACTTDVPLKPTLAGEQTEHPQELALRWLTAVGAQWYRLYQSTDVGSTWTQIGSDIAEDPDQNKISLHLPLHRQDWAKLRFQLEACNSYGCGPRSDSMNPGSRVPDITGYFKVDNADAGDQAGSSVSVSADGNTLALGARCEANGDGTSSVKGSSSNNAPCAGAAYLYHRDNDGDWAQAAYLKASHPDPHDHFGAALALSADGNTLVVGAPEEDSGAIGISDDASDNSQLKAGAAYVYTRSGNTWSLQAYVKASNTDAGDKFGSSVALSADGNTLAISAPGEDSAANGINSGDEGNDNVAAGDSGAVYVFTRSGSSWSQQAYVKASNTGRGDQFGSAVSLSADGSTLVVGAPREDSNATGINVSEADSVSTADSGAVYVFTRSGSTWSQQAYVKASNTGRNDQFGNAVSLSADGNLLAVGALAEDSEATDIDDEDQGDSSTAGEAFNAGAVYLFSRSGSSWSQQAYVKAPNTGRGDQFGSAVSLSADGNTLAVGAPGEAGGGSGMTADAENDSSPDAGAVYVYSRDGITWSAGRYVKSPGTDSEDKFGATLALTADGNVLVIGAAGEDSAVRDQILSEATTRIDNNALDSGAVYLY